MHTISVLIPTPLLALSPDAAALGLTVALVLAVLAHGFWLVIRFDNLLLKHGLSPVEARGATYRRLLLSLVLALAVGVPAVLLREPIFVDWLRLGGP